MRKPRDLPDYATLEVFDDKSGFRVEVGYADSWGCKHGYLIVMGKSPRGVRRLAKWLNDVADYIDERGAACK